MSLEIRGPLATTTGIALTEEDANALRQTARDVSDLDRRTLERAQASFRHAYDVAQRVSSGTLDPLSA
jgi:uncharacterized membrane protein